MFGRKSRKQRDVEAARAGLAEKATFLYKNAHKQVTKANVAAARAERTDQEQELLALHAIYIRALDTAHAYISEADRIEAELIWELPAIPEPTRKDA